MVPRRLRVRRAAGRGRFPKAAPAHGTGYLSRALSAQRKSSPGERFGKPNGPDGPADTLYFETRDFNFKSLKVNAVLRWEFRPGSVFYLAWTQERVDNDEYTGAFDLGPNTRTLFGRRPDNILLLKFTYWLNP